MARETSPSLGAPAVCRARQDSLQPSGSFRRAYAGVRRALAAARGPVKLPRVLGNRQGHSSKVLLDLSRQLIHSMDSGDMVLWELGLLGRAFGQLVRSLVCVPVLCWDPRRLRRGQVLVGLDLDRDDVPVADRIPKGSPLVGVGGVFKVRASTDPSYHDCTIYQNRGGARCAEERDA